MLQNHLHHQLCFENGCHACVCFLVMIRRRDWLVSLVYMRVNMPMSTKIIVTGKIVILHKAMYNTLGIFVYINTLLPPPPPYHANKHLHPLMSIHSYTPLSCQYTPSPTPPYHANTLLPPPHISCQQTPTPPYHINTFLHPPPSLSCQYTPSPTPPIS